MPNYEEYPIELRCDGGMLHGILKNGLLEIKCHHIRCTKGTRAVFHYYDPQTGVLRNTEVFNDPVPHMKGRKQ